MNPPLRGREDREALVEGLADGTIGGDRHRPCAAYGRRELRGLARSAMGIVGLECAFPLLYRYLVLPGTIPFGRLVEAMALAPRRIFGLEGGVEPGDEADFTVLDLEAEYRLDPAAFRSKGRATPFAAWPVRGRAVLTVVGGRVAYDGRSLRGAGTGRKRRRLRAADSVAAREGDCARAGTFAETMKFK